MHNENGRKLLTAFLDGLATRTMSWGASLDEGAVAEARAVVAAPVGLGSDVCPSDEEIAEHYAAQGGRWFVVCAPTFRIAAPVDVVTMRAGEKFMHGIIVRWHRVMADGSLR